MLIYAYPVPSSLLSPSGVPSAQRKRRTGWRWLRLVLFLVVAFAIANAVGGARGLTAFRDATSEFATLSEAVAHLRQENDTLQERARRLREDAAAVEDLARQELGLIRPGEKVFILRDQPLDAVVPPEQ